MKRKRFAMVTIGQTPRDDLVPEIRAQLVGLNVELIEFGALDPLSEGEIDALAPGPDEPRLVTRLRDGAEATVAKAAMDTLLDATLRRVDGQGFDAIVLLCTGQFGAIALQTPLIESQTVVDRAVADLARSTRRFGILLPHREQIAEFHEIAVTGSRLRFSHASPYGDRRFAEAGRELADSELIVMHCMGYSDAMRHAVAEASGRRVLLARQIVGEAMRTVAESPAPDPADRLAAG